MCGMSSIRVFSSISRFSGGRCTRFLTVTVLPTTDMSQCLRSKVGIASHAGTHDQGRARHGFRRQGERPCLRGSPIPRIRLASPVLGEEEIEAVAASSLRHANKWSGDRCRFEREFAAAHDVEHGVAVANGTVGFAAMLLPWTSVRVTK